MRFIFLALLLAASAPSLHAQASNAPVDRPVTVASDTAIARPDGSEEGNYVGKFLDRYQQQR